MLTKTEVEERLAICLDFSSLGITCAESEREALETALALWGERDEATEAHRYVLEGNTCLAKRIEELERERDEAWDRYAEVVTEKADAERECAELDGAVRLLGKVQTDLLAENRLLFEKAKNPWEKFIASDGKIGMREKAMPTTPLTAAEVARVKGLEAVTEAAKVLQAWHHKWQAPCTFEEALAGLDAALAALEVK